ncbi:MAG: HD domain-containing protein [Saccharofermentans sp.]|nr:HD domain-containing protein [Saccharofermentans sp.]
MVDPITEYRFAKEIFRHGKDLILTEEAQRMKSFIQHGTTSVFEHTVSVAKYSLKMANFLEKLGARIDRRSLVRGALLHDYFLYDWHEKNEYHNLHGFTHPGRALRNAIRDFDINDIESDIIRKHMFPLTPLPPKHIESTLVCIADKICAVLETFKIDICSYIIYRINLHRDITKGRVRLGQIKKHNKEAVN